MALRKGDQNAQWLRIEREKLDLDQKKEAKQRKAVCEEMKKLRDVTAPLSDAQRAAIVEKADGIPGIKLQ